MPDPRLSRRLSFLLRHRPEAAGLRLDRHGWADVDALLAALRVDREVLERLVREDDKQRYALVDGRIRAQQGHSVPVDLDLPSRRPPAVLWHGTSQEVLKAVLLQGLRPGQRNHVHLSPDPDTARGVGARHGSPVVLRVAAGEAWREGQVFLLSGNGVWLTEPLPPRYLSRC